MTAERSFVLKGFCPYDILAMYDEYGLDVGKHLRGDFCIEIQDGNKTVYITDFAGTKCAGKLPRNSTIVVEDNQIVSRTNNISTTDLYYNPPAGKEKQHSYKNFFIALDNAIAFRCKNNPTIFLSCGHDSGSIVTGAIRQDLKFNTLSYIENEDPEVLNKRLRLNKEFERWNDVGLISKSSIKGKILENESHVVLASSCKTNIALSGLGADEMYTSTDYQLMEVFIRDAEVQYNKYNIDVRYPLLDPIVFKEYFYLDKKLRPNNPKKKPFIEYMKSIGYPVYQGYKKSFII
jgi:hypothetical protein